MARCPKCGTELSAGGGHGYRFYFSYCYCDKCDEFVFWYSTPTTDKRKKELQNFVRSVMEKK